MNNFNITTKPQTIPKSNKRATMYNTNEKQSSLSVCYIQAMITMCLARKESKSPRKENSPSRAFINPSRQSPVSSPRLGSPLAGASVAVVLDVNVNRIVKVATELLRLLLGQSVSGDDCHV